MKNMHAFMPHGWCYQWDPKLVALHASTDVIIGLAYVTIPLLLMFIKPKIRDRRPYMVIFLMFVSSCGIGHFMDVVSIWHQLYWIKGLWNVVTAVLSAATAVVLIEPFLSFLRSQER